MTTIAKGGKADLRRPARHPDAGRPLPPHPRRHGQCRHLAVPRALPRRHRRHPGTRRAGGRPRPAPGLPATPPSELVDQGAEAITTNCGFLSLFQTELAQHVNVPVATSSLMQVPWVQATLPPGKRVGVITVSAKSLTPRHLASRRRPARHAHRRHRIRPGVLPRPDPRRQGRHGRRPSRARHPRCRRRPHPRDPCRYRRHRPGMHQHAALRRRPCRLRPDCPSTTYTR